VFFAAGHLLCIPGCMFLLLLTDYAYLPNMVSSVQTIAPSGSCGVILDGERGYQACTMPVLLTARLPTIR
jgi:hypothetical protein